MKYQVTFQIDEQIEKVTQLYTNKDRMKDWETGLVRIEEHKGVLFNTGSEGHLIFVDDQMETSMKIYVESNQLPKEIVMVYQLLGTWNRCVNTFKKVNKKTEWTMEVEFRFSEPQEFKLEQFIEHTANGMQSFKDFVEQNAKK